jgi:hypothetical protein
MSAPLTRGMTAAASRWMEGSSEKFAAAFSTNSGTLRRRGQGDLGARGGLRRFEVGLSDTGEPWRERCRLRWRTSVSSATMSGQAAAYRLAR